MNTGSLVCLGDVLTEKSGGMHGVERAVKGRSSLGGELWRYISSLEGWNPG